MKKSEKRCIDEKVYCFLKSTVCEDDPNYADGCREKAEIKNYCKDQEEFMRKNCPESCGFCSEGNWLHVFNMHNHEISEKRFCVCTDDTWVTDYGSWIMLLRGTLAGHIYYYGKFLVAILIKPNTGFKANSYR